ncbi:MAG: 1,4-alpha-glucan branching protein GlgB [Chitinivibrionales bacterium]|nr:1,4-alpha-glucan branching protein GlgB [Chitinivibrionales bacterium]
MARTKSKTAEKKPTKPTTAKKAARKPAARKKAVSKAGPAKAAKPKTTVPEAAPAEAAVPETTPAKAAPAPVKKRKTTLTAGEQLISDYDVHLFKAGNHFRLYDKLGAHLMEKDGVEGTHFAVWAPNAKRVTVVGDFNGWNVNETPLGARWDSSGIWEGFVPGIRQGEIYKYHIESEHTWHTVDKGDPYGFYWEIAPRTGSVVWDIDYEWHDSEWMDKRHEHNALDAPMSVYEVHIGSWRRVPEEDNRPLTYREMAPELIDYVKKMGFTHVEFLPVMEHPFYGSWGYQVVGYFAPTSRYGTPQDFMYLIDQLHQNDIGVILDWVPSHFPSNEHGLVYFDGSHLYEHADPRQGFHPDWQTYIFNYGRSEVRNFLISNALFWLDKYHADGLRVDAVASMLYLDYSRKEGEWIPNRFGGRENIEAIDFLRQFNETVYKEYPDVQTIAEESTSWPMVSRPVYAGGLGFGLKWNMGWMHDTLVYFNKSPIHRKYHQGDLTFSMIYAFHENFVLPLSHDEVVHGKGSLLNKMPEDDWQKFANLRLMFGYMYTHVGKKLLFMGGEFAQWAEWNHDTSLDWHLAQYDRHAGIQKWVSDLNAFYRSHPALHTFDFSHEGFRWVDCNDYENSVLVFTRHGREPKDDLLVAANFTPIPRQNYRIGVPRKGFWKEMLNSDAKIYGGSGQGNMGGQESIPVPSHGMDQSLVLTLPPLGVVVFGQEEAAE